LKVVKLPKNKLNDFLKRLTKLGKVYVPVKKGKNSYVFDEFKEGVEVAVDYTRTLLPPKKFFLPPKEEMFKFSKWGYFTTEPKVDNFVIFGVHPCDVNAINLLDKIFLDEYPDPYYKARREKSFIIEIASCMPDDKCMCYTFGTYIAEYGQDLCFIDIGEVFIVKIKTHKGFVLYHLGEGLFDENVSKEDLLELERVMAKRDKAFNKEVKMSDWISVIDLFDTDIGDEVWKTIASRCYGCGNCTMVCPTCHCWNVMDIVEIGELRGVRVRDWDSCQSYEYSLVAGGHSFTNIQVKRVKQRFTHKLTKEKGLPNCVGCGRCVAICFAEISPIEVLKLFTKYLKMEVKS